MDKYLTRSWSYRIRRLRVAIRYSWPMLAKVSGISSQSLRMIAKQTYGSIPKLSTIRRIRLLEHAFRDYIEAWERRGGNLSEWGSLDKYYGKYDGDNYSIGLRRGFVYVPNIPTQQADIDALGGIEVFNSLLSCKIGRGYISKRVAKKSARLASRVRYCERKSRETGQPIVGRRYPRPYNKKFQY